MLLFFLTNCFIIKAQNPLRRSHPLNYSDKLERPLESLDIDGKLNIVAVMVEFLPDENRLTSGNGTFGPGSLPYLENSDIAIDPLPHDRSYFEAHLDFVRDYYEAVSGGRLDIRFRVLPQTVKLDREMKFYSPTGENFTLEKLALLIRDSWLKVDEEGGFETDTLNSDETAFIIFHSGVGRDIQLTGTTLDITPQDIPSIFLGGEQLGNLLGDPSFDGIPINNGTFRITNSMIIPRTLSRRGEDVSGNEFVLQLSTNGLLAASVGSFLGLPDLFNTGTGEAGIGRFGLMDGAGIFSYNGLFPPEPSAWEKYFLGWITPSDISLDSQTPISVPAVSLRQPGSIARHLISGSEYFLIENRHRDTDNNGVELTIRKNDGSEIVQRFTNNDETFVSQLPGFTDLIEPGVVTAVSEYDWSLPGGLDRGADEMPGTADDRFLNGGILIWHIDETVIEQQLATQSVNANPDRRGVDLEEADGAQDIGRPVNQFTADRSNGTAFDFWWSGNNASVITQQGDTLTLYENRFAEDTHPNNKSNSGAPSFFEFRDFSDNQPLGSFTARSTNRFGISKKDLPLDQIDGDSFFISSNDPFRSNYPPGLSFFTTSEDSFLILPGKNTTFALHLNTDNNPVFDFQLAFPQQPLIKPQGTVNLLNSPQSGNVQIELQSWQRNDNIWQMVWNNFGSPNKGFLSTLDGESLLLDLTTERFNATNGTKLPELDQPELRTARAANGQTGILNPATLRITDDSFSTPVTTQQDRVYVGALDISPGKSAFFLLEEETLSVIDPESDSPTRILIRSSKLEWPAFADFDRDGRLDILIIDRVSNTINAMHTSGALLNSFPIDAPNESRFIGTPLVADIENDGENDLLAVVQDSISMNIFAYGSDGRIKSGFPLFVGTVNNPDNQPVHPLIIDRTLFAVSHTGDLKAWRFRDITNVQWRSRYHNVQSNKVTGRVSGADPVITPSPILVKNETYNWPNPASGTTHIRYQTNGPGIVELKIITMNGSVIFEEQFNTIGGVPEEQRISTENWGSGIYFGMVTATVNGQTDSKLIKIAVVH